MSDARQSFGSLRRVHAKENRRLFFGFGMSEHLSDIERKTQIAALAKSDLRTGNQRDFAL